MANEEKIECLKAVFIYGCAALKTMLYLNGGAIIALLAFCGRLAGTDQVSVIQIFANALLVFCWGVFLAAVSAALTYLCQWVYMIDHKKSFVIGLNMNIAVVFVSAISLLCFIFGAYRALEGFLILK